MALKNPKFGTYLQKFPYDALKLNQFFYFSDFFK